MAITFSKNLSTTNLLNAHNNNTVVFSSDNVLDSIKCEIDFNGIKFEITPINNIFKYNLKQISKNLINTKRLIDDITPSLTFGDVTSHIYNATDGSYLSLVSAYTITFSDNSTETISYTYNFLNSVEQLEQNSLGTILGSGGLYLLSPFLKETANTYNTTYVEGYPFDISIYSNTTGLLTVLNQTNGLSYDFNMVDKVNRLFLSDGRLTITIDDYLPMVYGLNELKLTKGADIIYLNVYKEESFDSQYLKWLNQYGGWSYWNFNCIYKRERNTKENEEVVNDFNDVSLTNDPYLQIGKDSVDTLTLVTENIDENNQLILNDLLDSPKVYYFTGKRLTQIANNSWLSVNLKGGNTTIKDYKRNVNKYKLQIELPKRYTIKL